MRIGITALIFATLVACNREPTPPTSMSNLVFLTRGGCVNTTTMRANLDEALKAMGLPHDHGRAHWISHADRPLCEPRRVRHGGPDAAIP
jgi:hypothetical protein